MLVWIAEGRPDTSQARRSGAVEDPLGPNTRAGKKLARLMGIESISATYATVTLVDHWKGRARKGDAPKGIGSENAAHLLQSLPEGARLVLVGQRVAAAFLRTELRSRYFRWVEAYYGDDPQQEVSWARMRHVVAIPHPQDGRWWGEDRNATKAARFFRALAREGG